MRIYERLWRNITLVSAIPSDISVLNSLTIIKRFAKWFFGALLFGVLAVVGCYWAIENFGGKYTYSEVSHVPKNKVGLVLGTSKRVKSGHQNLYFKYRIDAAERLYKSGKISYIIVSGDNGTKAYNEPRDMKSELVKRGIPEAKIYCDYAGFRTFDSVIRCREIFDQTAYTIISQPFHNERAVFIARSKGMDAVGFNAKAVVGPNAKPTQLREVLARVKVFIDLATDKKPRYLGDKVPIG